MLLTTEIRQGELTGTLTGPSHFTEDSEGKLTDIKKPIRTTPVKGRKSEHGVELEMGYQGEEDTMHMTLVKKNHAALSLFHSQVPDLQFGRVSSRQTIAVANDWPLYSDEPQAVAAQKEPDDGVPSNPEMKRIFDEDQRVRQPGVNIDWPTVNQSDAERREATTKLLNEGALHSGEDFTWAAFVFQHGSTSSDYLLAHTLALIAVKKGYRDALWIATATLDRYLQSIHQPQIYGTQFLTPQRQPATQEPYDRSLISDTIRRLLGVPIQSAQEEQRKKYDTQRAITK